MGLKDKLKVSTNLKAQIENEQEGKGADKRILNYYDLKDNDKMRVLIVPDESGAVWKKFKKHGPNLEVRGLETIGCANDDGGEGDCFACQQAYDLLDQFRETEDKAYKDEAKKWFPREYMLMNVVVLDAPISINEDKDGNQVKLWYVPRAIEKIIKQHIEEGLLDSDELTTTPLVIKKTKNDGGRNDYSTSFFERKQINDDDLDVFDDLMVEPYNLDEVDLVPEAPTDEELREWVEKARKKVESAKNGDNQSEDGDKKSGSSKESPRDRLRRNKAKKEEKTEEDDSGDDGSQDVDGSQENDSSSSESDDSKNESSDSDDSSGEEEEASKKTTSVRDRLNRVRNRS